MGFRLLTGSYLRSFDDKQRFSLPKAIRAVLSSADNLIVYLAPGTDGSLSVYSEPAFQGLAQQLRSGSPTAQQTRDFSRLFYAQAQRIEVDRQGRIRVPTALARLAELKDEVMLVGVGEYLELWSPARWQAYLTEKQGHYDQIAEQAFAQPSSTGSPVTQDADRPRQPR